MMDVLIVGFGAGLLTATIVSAVVAHFLVKRARASAGDRAFSLSIEAAKDYSEGLRDCDVTHKQADGAEQVAGILEGVQRYHRFVTGME